MRKRKMLIICMAVVMIFTADGNWQTFNDESFG